MKADSLTMTAKAIDCLGSDADAEVVARARRMIETNIGTILKVMIDAANAGDGLAQRLLIERSIPIAKSPTLRQPIDLTGTIPQKVAQVRDALAKGDLTLDEAKALTDTLIAEQTVAENAAVVERLNQIERQLAGLDKPARGNVIDAEVEVAPPGLPAPRGGRDEF